MKHIYPLLLLTFFSANVFSQTKIIAHKNHSGAPGSFTLLAMDNMGVAPRDWNYDPVICDSIVQTSCDEVVLFFRRGFTPFQQKVVNAKSINEIIASNRKLYPAAKFVPFSEEVFHNKNNYKQKKNSMPFFTSPGNPGGGPSNGMMMICLSLFVLSLFAIIARTNLAATARVKHAV